MLRKLGIALAFACVATMAHAQTQQTRSQINTQNNNNITTNGHGAISGAVLNVLLGNMNASYGVLNDANSWTGTNTFVSAPIISGQTGPCVANGSGPMLCSLSPILGTPASVNLLNATGLPFSTGVSGLGANVASAAGNALNGSGALVGTTSPTINTPNLVGDNLTVNPAARDLGPYVYYYAPYFTGISGDNPYGSFGFELIATANAASGGGGLINAAVINPGAASCLTKVTCQGDIDFIVYNGHTGQNEFYSLFSGTATNAGGLIPDVTNRNILGQANNTWKWVFADAYYVQDATLPLVQLNSTTANQSQEILFQNAGTTSFSILVGYAAGNYWSLYDNAYGQATIYQAANGNLTLSPHGNVILNPASGYETTTPFLALAPASINYASGAITAANTVLSTTTYAYGSVTGSGLNGYRALNTISLSDAVVSGSTPYFVFDVIDQIGAGATGNRSTIFGVASVSGLPGANLSAVGVEGQAYVNVNMGGTTGAYTNAVGSTFGGNSQVISYSGATYLIGVIGHEFDVEIDTGASAAESHAATLVHTSGHRVRATYDDSAMEMATQDNASDPGWKYGIAFGGYAHQWDFASDSTLIYAWTRQSGTASSSVAAIGIDFSNVTFGTAFLKSTGFLVDGSGAETLTKATFTAAAPTVAASQVGIGGTVSAATSCGSLASSAGCLVINVAGTTRYIPYY